MKRFLSLWLLLAVLFPTSALARGDDADGPPPDHPPRFILCDSYCALVDASGALVTHRVFDKLDAFSGPVALYKYHDKMGAIDRSGKTIIKPIHDDLSVLGNAFIAADDAVGKKEDDPHRQQLYDANGKLLWQATGDYLSVGIWGGHPYYAENCNTNAATACRYVFLDAAGNTLATFGGFTEGTDDTLTPASPDGKHYGYIDASLHFVIPPVFLHAERFTRDVAKITTVNGVGLVDRKGRVIVKPGKYQSLYPWENTPLIDAFRPDDKKCGTYLRQNGAAIHLPKGICPDSPDGLPALGYALVRDGNHDLGTIDARGKIRVRPHYPWLQGINRDYLAFGDDWSAPKAVGVMDARGKVIIPARFTRIETWTGGCCSNFDMLHDAFVAWTAQRAGLIDLHGNWLVLARFTDVDVMSADLIAFKDDKDVYHFYTSAGRPLALTSDGDPEWIGAKSDVANRFFTFVRRVDKHDRGGSWTVWSKGLADPQGNVILPATFSAIDYVGDGLLAATTKGRNGTDIIDLYDSAGNKRGGDLRELKAQFRSGAPLTAPFKYGVAVAQSVDYKAILIDAHGEVLTSFATLFPDLANRDDVDQGRTSAIDICYDADPAAEPGDRVTQNPKVEAICASPALRRESRITETRYHSALGDDCLPDTFRALRPVYDGDLGKCDDDQCASRAMKAFQAAIDATDHRCAARAPKLDLGKTPVPKALQAKLLKQIAVISPDDMADVEVTDGNPAIYFSIVGLGGRRAIIATGSTGGNSVNDPTWLFVQTAKGDWRNIFADYASGFGATDATRNGFPILRTTQRSSCCENDVDYFAYDGHRYTSIDGCDQLYDKNETTVAFCGDGKPDSAVSPN